MKLGTGTKSVMIFLIILPLSVMNIATAVDTDYEWEPVTTIIDDPVVREIEINSASDSLFVASGPALHEWGIINATLLWSWRPPTYGPEKMDWNDEYEWMAWFSTEQNSEADRIWASEVVVFDHERTPIAGLEPYGELKGRPNTTVVDIEWCPGTPYLTVAFKDGVIVIYDIQDLSVLLVHEWDGSRIRDMEWNPSGTVLGILTLSGAFGWRNLHFLDLAENYSWQVPLYQYGIDRLGWYFDGTLLFLMHIGWGLLQLDVDSQTYTKITDRQLIAFAPSPVDPTIVFIEENRVTFHDLETNTTEFHVFPRKMTDQTGWTADGSFVCSVDEDGIIRIWGRTPGTPPPRVGIRIPEEDTIVAANVTVSGWAESHHGDDSEMVLVKVNALDWARAEGFNPWNLIIDTTVFPDGALIVRAKAVDPSGESDVAVRRLQVDNTGANVRPRIVISSPANGTHVGPIAEVTGTASDDRGVLSVQFRLEDELWREVVLESTSQEVPWRVHVPLFYYEGNVTIHLRAFDGSEFSAIESVTVFKEETDPDPSMTVVVDYPGDGWTVPQTFKVHGHVLGPVPDEVLILLLDNTVVVAKGTRLWEHTFEHLHSGSHQFRIRAVKGERYSPWAMLTVDVGPAVPSNKPPRVEILRPANGTVLSESQVLVEGLSFDDVEVQKVEVRVSGGKWREASGTTEWTHRLDLDSMDSGYVRVEARAFDGEEYSDTVMCRYYYDGARVIGPRESFLLIVVLVAIVAIQLVYIYLQRKRAKENGDGA